MTRTNESKAEAIAQASKEKKARRALSKAPVKYDDHARQGGLQVQDRGFDLMPATRAASGVRHGAHAEKITMTAAIGLFDFTSIYQAAPMERIDLIKRGVQAFDVGRLAEWLETSKENLMRQLGLPRATVDRKAKDRQNLSMEQAERVVGLSKLVGQVQTMVEESGDPRGFNAPLWVGQWLERPNAALGGQRPGELLDTVAGQELVSSILAKMQSGAYA